MFVFIPSSIPKVRFGPDGSISSVTYTIFNIHILFMKKSKYKRQYKEAAMFRPVSNTTPKYIDAILYRTTNLTPKSDCKSLN